MKSWDEDLFDRQQLAEDLISYAETVSEHGMLLHEKRSLVVGVDAEYGIGKTFFLKGLEIKLQEAHPVAYIDAWADDILDEPLVALAAMIKKSIEPLLATKSVKKSLGDFMAKTGKVVKIGGKGLAKRGAQLIITGAAVDGITDVISGDEDESLKELEEDIEKAMANAMEDVEGDLEAIKANRNLARRLAEFEAGQRAISDMLRSLTALVESVSESGKSPPIFIIIDELDRCRPAYAVKLLEEVKHLFSVPGLVFLLGVNSKQLGNAVSGIYGEKFDGSSYLDRFIDRKILLPYPPLILLVTDLLSKISGSDRLIFPKVEHERSTLEKAEILALLLEFHGVPPRMVFKFFDRLQTCLALTGNDPLEGISLSETICEELVGKNNEHGRKWSYGFSSGFDFQWVEADVSSRNLRNLTFLTESEARKSHTGDSPFNEYVFHFLGNPSGRSSPTRYRSLLQNVVTLAGDGA